MARRPAITPEPSWGAGNEQNRPTGPGGERLRVVAEGGAGRADLPAPAWEPAGGRPAVFALSSPLNEGRGWSETVGFAGEGVGQTHAWTRIPATQRAVMRERMSASRCGRLPSSAQQDWRFWRRTCGALAMIPQVGATLHAASSQGHRLQTATQSSPPSGGGGGARRLGPWQCKQGRVQKLALACAPATQRKATSE